MNQRTDEEPPQQDEEVVGLWEQGRAKVALMASGAIRMDVGGRVVVLPAEEWHALAWHVPSIAATGATPRVDKVAHGCMECGDRVDADFARQLERERDEARRELAEANRLLKLADGPMLERAEARVRELEAQPPAAAAPQSAIGAPWPLDTLICLGLDELFKLYNIDFPRTHSDLRKMLSVIEKRMAPTDDAGSKG